MTTSGLRRWPLATGRPETWTAGQRTRRDELLVHRPQAVTPFEGTQLRAECPCPSTGTSQPHVWISSGGRTDLMNAVNTACGRAIGRRAALGPPQEEGVAPWGLVVGRSFCDARASAPHWSYTRCDDEVKTKCAHFSRTHERAARNLLRDNCLRT